MAKFTALFFMVISTVLISSSLLYADFKAYPGSICQVGISDRDTGIKRHASRGIGNYSSEYRWIVCPIIKDAVDEYVHSLEVWVYLNSSSAPVECNLLASTPYGTTVDQDHGVATGNAVNIHLKTEQGHAYGSWGLHCRLAPNAVLHSYLALEHAVE